jgi:hypothetical protein
MSNLSVIVVDEIDDKEASPDGQHFLSNQAPGTISWSNWYNSDEVAGCFYVCPCGCRVVGFLSVRSAMRQESPSWEWNGDKDKPTMKPSIQKTSPCKWHGYLTDGVFKSC